jgi:hypothetical protein
LQRAGKQTILSLSLAVLLWGGMAVTSSLPSHASASSASTLAGRLESVLERTSPNVDKIVDRYVRSHMFDDDAYDPIESLYREAFHDATTGQHPGALAEITGSVLGGTAAGAADKSKKLMSAPTSEGFATWLTSTIQKLVQKGWSESSAILLLAGVFVIAGPSLFLFVGMIIGGISKRNIQSVMKKRYGDTYTVDATIRTEESVEAPDDEDDDDGDDDEDEDDDDKDEDDDDEDDE